MSVFRPRISFDITMKLDPPLASLFARCQTICVAECCGIDAYDFSPIHMASYLTMYGGKIDPSGLKTLIGQIEALKANYGSGQASEGGATFDDLNASLTAAAVDSLADELLANLAVAVKLVEISEEQRWAAGLMDTDLSS